MYFERIKTFVINNAFKSIIFNNTPRTYQLPTMAKGLEIVHCWNRNPVARFPKKANHGALPKSHALRRIRKRLRTGK